MKFGQKMDLAQNLEKKIILYFPFLSKSPKNRLFHETSVGYKFMQIAEWKSEYFNYKILKKKLKIVQNDVIALGKSWAEINRIRGSSDSQPINEFDLSHYKELTQHLNLEIQRPSDFYDQQIDRCVDRLCELVSQLIDARLIDDYQPEDEEFTSQIERELLKVGFKQGIVKSKSKKQEAQNETNSARFNRLRNAGIARVERSMTSTQRKRTASEIQAEFLEFYRVIIMLHKFAQLNILALTKFLKKHDKNLGVPIRNSFLQMIENKGMLSHQWMKTLEREVESLFARVWTNGERKEAMEQLRVTNLTETTASSGFFLGLNLGLSAISISFATFWLAVDGLDVFKKFGSFIVVYRFIGLLTCYMWTLGLCMYLWPRNMIDYVNILKLNARKHSGFQLVLKVASFFTISWSVTASLMLFGDRDMDIIPLIPWYAYPMTLSIVFSSFIIYLMIGVSDFFFLRTILRVLTPGLRSLTFADNFVGEHVSLFVVLISQDVVYFICDSELECTKSTQVFVRCLCVSFCAVLLALRNVRQFLDSKRKTQEISEHKHQIYLWNCGKYVSLIVCCCFGLWETNLNSTNSTNNGFFLSKFIASVCISSVYFVLMDIYHDWDFGQNHKFLGRKLLFQKEFYYVVFITNSILRVSWVLFVSGLLSFGFWESTLVCFLEIVRFLFWNLIRMEREQVEMSKRVANSLVDNSTE